MCAIPAPLIERSTCCSKQGNICIVVSLVMLVACLPFIYRCRKSTLDKHEDSSQHKESMLDWAGDVYVPASSRPSEHAPTVEEGLRGLESQAQRRKCKQLKAVAYLLTRDRPILEYVGDLTACTACLCACAEML